MRDVDELDERLIAELRLNGREPVATLAHRLGVTRATINNRINRLVDDGIVLGFTVRVREDVSTDVVRAVSLIEVEGRTTSDVIDRLRGFPEVHALHTTNGGWDLVADLRTDSLASFDRLLARIRGVEGVINSETSLLLSSALR
ncbi:Lrp/AsnC family transcriptional regulator [Paramicrobacterium agarici]|uniref:DNA-binding Lrp family transcriptional regulator n=1 Tax=Paramicrobacterium agarici TaxID=630514 RepID=A0A2A9DUS7_9MICO|nr:Lrp/AsnC family transcriptional regulator [Microbacterium agarici]PFG29742.1 DNA-binding Lrp family transcriptional regulator [Microbacterium agarici]TQO22764.1 DNA-binding Lrp family transcriptional regulator [Microbacterium agarici]